MKTIITRFPPSPSGYLHVGGARTALFNWLYVRHMGGRFVLRFEDTDRERSSQASVDAILDALVWLGIDWDDGPYYQSERTAIYKEHIKRLVDEGHAYYCTCSPEEVEAMRKAGMAAGGQAKYDGTCREKGLTGSPGAVVRFKSPRVGTTVVEDRVKGNIVFQNSEIDDFIIQRSDGSPIYNLAVVVDDITMGINTIIRGDDHVSNTPKQLMLYKALGAELPDLAHAPMVLGSDRSRLSKRHGAMSITEYREKGYLPDAVVNYLVRLGWSHGDQEFFQRQELIEKFDLAQIGRSAGVFDPEKLLALNADHIQAARPDRLAVQLLPFLKARGITEVDGEYLCKVIPTLTQRSKTLEEMAAGAEFYFQKKIVYDEKAAKKFLKPAALDPMRLLITALEALTVFTPENLEEVFQGVMDQTGLKLGKIAQPVRVALTGKTFSPGIFEIIDVIGRVETLNRLGVAVAYIESEKEVV